MVPLCSMSPVCRCIREQWRPVTRCMHQPKTWATLTSMLEKLYLHCPMPQVLHGGHCVLILKCIGAGGANNYCRWLGEDRKEGRSWGHCFPGYQRRLHSSESPGKPSSL